MAIITRIYLGGKKSQTLKSDNFSAPIEMYSIAMDTDEEIKAFMQKAPSVEVETNELHPMYGVPIARNRQQKLEALRAVEFAERN